jgi:hypothetical protein
LSRGCKTVSQPNDNPARYRVIYSEYVRQELRKLAARAIERGLRQQLLDSLKQLESRLSIYPQFGEPLRDLQTEGETLWVGTIRPLVAQYVIDEARRTVFIVHPIVPLIGSGL